MEEEKSRSGISVIKVWRLVNIAVFTVGLFGPWGTVFGDIVYGFHMLVIPFGFMVDSILGSVPGYWMAWSLYYCFGWVWFGTYWLVNITRVFGKSSRWKRIWLTIPLVVSAGFLILDTRSRILYDPLNRFWWPDLYWGYWLLLFSIGSSVLLEISNHLIGLIQRIQGRSKLTTETMSHTGSLLE